MKYNRLGESELNVSEICLGTMTYGQQNTIKDAHQQLDYAIAQGINFIDTAEMYPVPPRPVTQGLTESYIGEWLAHQQRDRYILATKMIGAGRSQKWVRDDAQTALSRQNILQAVDDSLKRLQTDYIDLYQIHWPDRNVPIFGQTSFDPTKERESVPIAEQLATFAEVIQAGKIRYIGLSNETSWGVCQFSQAAAQLQLPKIISIQNAYSLINRVFESSLAEVCYREKVGLLAYSPLAFGMLSGKYLQAPPICARLSEFPHFGQRYQKINVNEAVSTYVAIAQQHQISPSTLALAFVRSRWFVTSTIIGATTLSQLQENITSATFTLDSDVLAEIEEIHHRYPNSAP